ncbi:MAG: regulatory protein RecX [Oscillospiraceae bacterium]
MTISKLAPSKRVEGRWLAFLEDGTILRLGENEVIQFALYAGKELDEAEAAALLDSARRSELKEKALELLSRKPQSRRELERKLRQWEAGEEEIAALCDRMEELGYLNDAAYAAQVVRHYSAKGFGERKLRDELYRRGVPRDLWDEALEQAEDPADAIDEFVAKKLAGKPADRKELKKVSDALARRGYSWNDISAALSRYGAECGE